MSLIVASHVTKAVDLCVLNVCECRCVCVCISALIFCGKPYNLPNIPTQQCHVTVLMSTVIEEVTHIHTHTHTEALAGYECFMTAVIFFMAAV